MRHLFHLHGITDLSKLEEDAWLTAKGDNRNPPVATKIHYHKIHEKCNDRCRVIEPKNG